MKRLTLAALLILAAHAGAAAQEDYGEYDGPLDVITLRPVPVRRGPSDATPVVATRPAGTPLRMLELQPRGGFLRVAAPGLRGWVWAGAVRVDESSADRGPTRGPAGVAEAARSGPCLDVGALGACPTSGCAAGGSPKAVAEALLNQVKRGRGMTGTRARLIDFNILLALQEAATDQVGQGSHLQAADRAAVRRIGEGRLVRLAGFLARDEENPRAAGPESVNCRLPRAENNDIHVNVTPTAEGEEFDGVVVEMTPERPERVSEGWTRRKLLKVKRERRAVLAEGQLFYDNRHLVRRRENTGAGFRNQPKRISLWEIHPVTRFFVCTRDRNACDPRRPEQWTPLETF